MKIGVILRTGWRGEAPDMDRPAQAFSRLLAEAIAAASAGAECLFVYDHLEAVPSVRDVGCFEAWTTLAALGVSVPRVRIGSLVSGVSLRNPGLLAKMAATVDAMSNGRLIVGLGAGWYRDELRRYGFPVMPYRDRVVATAQTIRALRELWTGEPTNVTVGRTHIDGAICMPRPTAASGIPLWVGGSSPAMRRVATEAADGINIGGTPAEVGQLIGQLVRALGDHGRARAELEISIEAQLLITPAAHELGRIAAQSGASPDEFVGSNLVGTPAEITNRVRAYEAAGVDTLIVFCPLADSLNEFFNAIAIVRQAVEHA